MKTNQVSEMSGTFSHVSGAGLTSRQTVDDALTRVHEAAELRASALHHFRKPDATFRHGRPTDLLRAEDAELDPLNRPDGGLRVPSVNCRHLSGCWVWSNKK